MAHQTAQQEVLLDVRPPPLGKGYERSLSRQIIVLKVSTIGQQFLPSLVTLTQEGILHFRQL
jgi:hypothetical protein